MKITRISAFILILGALCPPRAAGADPFRDLSQGDEDARSQAALEILRDADEHTESVVRRAAFVASQIPEAKHLPHLTHLVDRADLTNATRASAALALGIIGRDHPRLWPPGEGDPLVHRPLPVFTKRALMRGLDATVATPVRRACAEALGTAGVVAALDLLRALRDDASEDALLRIAAGRALTRLTGVPSVPSGQELVAP